MILIFSIVCISAILFGLFKAVSDRVASKDLWQKSIFSKKEIDSFFGCKDFTWKRKDSPNKVLNYLQHTILVFYTDIWHFSNMMQKASLLLLIIPYGDHQFLSILIVFISICLWALLSSLSFHLFYHRIFLLRTSKDTF